VHEKKEIDMRHGKQERGFTLVETIIALFVTALVILGCVGLNILINKNSEEMNERTIALQNANQVIEQMRAASNTGTFPDNVVTAFPDGGHPAGFAALPNEQVTVSYASATATPLDVTITVSWRSYAGRQSSETVQTYIIQR
jgi:Tfp pilus assembly protein PilV